MTPADDAALVLASEILKLRVERLAIRFDMGILEAGERLEDLADVRAGVRAMLHTWRVEQLAQLRRTLAPETTDTLTDAGPPCAPSEVDALSESSASRPERRSIH